MTRQTSLDEYVPAGDAEIDTKFRRGRESPSSNRRRRTHDLSLDVSRHFDQNATPQFRDNDTFHDQYQRDCRSPRACRESSNQSRRFAPAEPPKTLEDVKRNLLKRNDWAGLSATRPLKMKFPSVEESGQVGKRRKITEEDRARRNGPARVLHPPSLDNRLGQGLSERSYSDRDTLEDLSIRIGEAIHHSQTTEYPSQLREPAPSMDRQSSESMLLDKEEARYMNPETPQMPLEHQRIYNSASVNDYQDTDSQRILSPAGTQSPGHIPGAPYAEGLPARILVPRPQQHFGSSGKLSRMTRRSAIRNVHSQYRSIPSLGSNEGHLDPSSYLASRREGSSDNVRDFDGSQMQREHAPRRGDLQSFAILPTIMSTAARPRYTVDRPHITEFPQHFDLLKCKMLSGNFPQSRAHIPDRHVYVDLNSRVEEPEQTEGPTPQGKQHESLDTIGDVAERISTLNANENTGKPLRFEPVLKSVLPADRAGHTADSSFSDAVLQPFNNPRPRLESPLKTKTPPKDNDDEPWLRFIFGDGLDGADTNAAMQHVDLHGLERDKSRKLAKLQGSVDSSLLEEPTLHSSAENREAVSSPGMTIQTSANTYLNNMQSPIRSESSPATLLDQTCELDFSPQTSTLQGSADGLLAQTSTHARAARTVQGRTSSPEESLAQLSSQNDPETNHQDVSPEGSLALASMYNNATQTVAVEPSSSDAVQMTSPAVRDRSQVPVGKLHTDTPHKIMFTRPQPFSGNRAESMRADQDRIAQHIGRNVIGRQAETRKPRRFNPTQPQFKFVPKIPDFVGDGVSDVESIDD